MSKSDSIALYSIIDKLKTQLEAKDKLLGECREGYSTLEQFIRNGSMADLSYADCNRCLFVIDAFITKLTPEAT